MIEPIADDAPAQSEPGPEEPSEARVASAATPETGEGEAESELAAAQRERDEALRRADELWDRYLRAEAEIDNTRKRAQRAREEALVQQRRELLGQVLTVMDNLERALAHADTGPESLKSGLEATYRELGRMLAAQGVERIEALDAPFDPQLHEAAAVVPVADAEQERVVAVDRPGYTLDGLLLRPARVVVGQPIE
jgi:molecular chaperone GrpE